MLIFWKVALESGTGYLVFRGDLNNALGVYTDAGEFVADPGDYTTTDSGASPAIGTPAPPWGEKLNA